MSVVPYSMNRGASVFFFVEMKVEVGGLFVSSYHPKNIFDNENEKATIGSLLLVHGCLRRTGSKS